MKFLKKPSFLIVIAAISFIGLGFVSIDWTQRPGLDEQGKMLNIGDKAPELSYPDPEGNVRNLSDLKGKIVLVDFWASWCRPCRAENPNVVRIYDKYKNANFKNAKGFEVFSYSLDRNKTDWVKAIEADNLKWDNHVSDLKFWQGEGAAKYNVNAIPATFLIDGEGTIVGIGLRGTRLEQALQQLAE